MTDQTSDNTAVWSAWREAAALPAIDAALRELYAELDAAVSAQSPTCWTSGKCCKFDDFGHRLYVTGLEIAWFLTQVASATSGGDGQRVVAEDRKPGNENRLGPTGVRLPQFAEHVGACPYQVEGLCSTHAVRPLGCRIFFCQQGTEAWQQDLYESFLDRLRLLHDKHALDYRYMDWIAGLTEAAAGAGSARG